MQHQTPAMSPSWRGRVRALLSRFFRPNHPDTPSVVGGEVKPIDFEGEDTSLTEQDLQIMK